MHKINLHDYDAVVVNTSAGKDSQAMMAFLKVMATAQHYPLSKVHAVHADLGRVEWAGTRDLAERQAQALGFRFHVVSRPQGDLLDHVEQRGMWPSSKQRYCTSDHKRGQVQKVIVKIDRGIKLATGKKHTRILNCMGLRADESPARSKLEPLVENDKRRSCQSRQVDTWLPIHAWTEDEVWNVNREAKRTWGVEHHPAYDLGLPRLSCVFCIFAPRSALVLAGRYNRDLLDAYVDVEQKIGHRFRDKLSLVDVRAAVEDGEAIEDSIQSWCM